MTSDGCFVNVDWDDDTKEATITASDEQKMILTYHEVSLLMHELVDRCGDPAYEFDGTLDRTRGEGSCEHR